MGLKSFEKELWPKNLLAFSMSAEIYRQKYSEIQFEIQQAM